MIRRLLTTALLAGTALSAAGAQTAAPPPAVASVAVPPLAFTQRTLANGLTVYALRDPSTPNVSIQMWYEVGAKNDPAGRSGFAHMFEHLMFKATRNLPSESFDRLTEDVGGYNNASTDDDFTNYYEVVPANHLERLLFAEADRMASLVVEPVSFASERDVVKEELRQRTLATPYGKLFSIDVPEVAYTVSPYARPPIGNIADLEAAGIADVRAFHAVYYRPDNAILVVSGNFDPAQLDGWVDRYFGPIPRPTTAIPRVTAVEPPRAGPVTRTVYEPNTPLPAVLLNWQVPPDRNPDIAALTVLDAVLATGESSRLYQSLVYRDRLANSAETILDTRVGIGNLNVYAIMAGGKTAAEGEAALRRQVAGLRDAPIAADERLAAIQRVTAADVQRVARRWLPDDRAAVIRYLPAEARPAGAASDTIAVAPTVQVTPLAAPADVAVVTPADAAHRRAPPPPGAPVAPVLPVPVETRLANGLHVVTVERHDLPLVTASLVALGGGSDDALGHEGSASLAAAVMTKGTATRSATQIAQAMEALGTSLGSDAGRDSALVSATVVTPAAAAALPIIADVARHPTFAPDEIDRARGQAIDGISVEMSDPSRLAGLVANRLVFGDGGYGAPLSGTLSSLAAITRGDLQSSYKATWEPARTTLVLVGDITPSAATALAERTLGDWKPLDPDIVGSPVVRHHLHPAPRVVVVDLPDAGQAGVVVARPGIARSDGRYYALDIANAVLGGGFSSRLNEEIRVKRGLAYGAGSSAGARRSGGIVAAATQTKNPTAAEVTQLIVAEMKRMGTAPVAAAELDTRRAGAIGDFGRGIETDEGIAGAIGAYVATGVAPGELDRVVERLAAVRPGDVQAVSAALLDPAAASIVVVGDARQFLPALRRLYPQAEVIAAKDLKLDTVTLR